MIVILNDFESYISGLGSVPQRIEIDSNEPINDDLTVPGTVDLVVKSPGKFTIASGKTLTLTKAPSAGLSQIFDGAGNVIATGKGHPEWFGIDESADDVQIQACYDAFLQTVLQPKTYYLSNGLILNVDNKSLYCESGLVILSTSQDIDVVTISKRAYARNILIWCTNANPTKACWKFVDGAKNGRFFNLWANNNAYGFYFYSSTSTGVAYNTFDSCYEGGNKVRSVLIHTSGVGWVNQNLFNGIGIHAAITALPIEIRDDGNSMPNQNLFKDGSIEGGIATDFAVRDYGLNGFGGMRIETNGMGLYFENDTASWGIVPRAIGNYYYSDRYPEIVCKSGRLISDILWGVPNGGGVIGEGYVATSVDADSSSGQKVLNVADTSTFIVGMPVLINENGDREEWGKIASISAGVSITLVNDLIYTHTAVQGDSVQAFGKPSEILTG